MIRVLALMGLPGAGKTGLAHALAEQLHWPLIGRDAFARERFDEAGKAAATDAAFEAVAAQLARSQSCIVDGMTFAGSAQRERLRELARQHDAHAMLLWLECPVDVAAARVRAQRNHPALDRDEALVRDVARRFAPPEPDVVRLDGRLPTQQLLQQALTLL